MNVASVTDIVPGTSKQVMVGAQPVALFNVGGMFYALDDVCPHAGCPLSEGGLDGTTLTCSCHGSRFDVTNGALLGGPATRAARSFRVRVTGADLDVLT